MNAKAKVKGPVPTSGTAAPGRNAAQLMQRVKRELLWVLVSSAVAMALGLIAGNLLKI